jgi:membrane peptidoglycan carboxypeptidase
VANGGILYRPYVVKRVQHPQKGVLSETEPYGERVISTDTASKLRDMLEVVVTDGTATSGKLEGYTAAGKTGTAQKVDSTGHYSKTAHVASFAGFAPASNPVVSIIVMVDEPAYGQHHGSNVAPVFKRIAEQVLRYMSVPPDVPSYAPQYTVKVPKPLPEPPLQQAAAAACVGAACAKYVVASLSTSQPEMPEFGEITVPDFHGKSLRQVTDETLKAGLRLQSVGSGAAVDQAPAPGSSVRAGTRIQVRFSNRLGR